MKKVCIILMSALFLLTLSACSSKQMNVSTTTDATRTKKSEVELHNTQSRTA